MRVACNPSSLLNSFQRLKKKKKDMVSALVPRADNSKTNGTIITGFVPTVTSHSNGLKSK